MNFEDPNFKKYKAELIIQDLCYKSFTNADLWKKYTRRELANETGRNVVNSTGIIDTVTIPNNKNRLVVKLCLIAVLICFIGGFMMRSGSESALTILIIGQIMNFTCFIWALVRLWNTGGITNESTNGLSLEAVKKPAFKDQNSEPESKPKKTAEDKLEELKKLLDSDLISNDIYEGKAQKIVNDI